MADLKISQLPAATTPVAGTEVLPIVQSGTTSKVAISDLTAGRSVAASDITVTTAFATTFDTNIAAAGMTMAGSSIVADGTDADISINITPKGTGAVALADAILSRPTLKDYAAEGVAIGNTSVPATGVVAAGSWEIFKSAIFYSNKIKSPSSWTKLAPDSVSRLLAVMSSSKSPENSEIMPPSPMATALRSPTPKLIEC